VSELSRFLKPKIYSWRLLNHGHRRSTLYVEDDGSIAGTSSTDRQP
jgi:hypothetical protein